MKEFGALFVSGYLISSFLMLPLVGLYLILSVKRVFIRHVLNFHKALTILTITLPILMVLMSYDGTFEGGLSKWNKGSQVLMDDGLAVDSPDIVGPVDVPYPDKTSDKLPTLQDVVFHFVDLITLFSVLGLLMFALRYALQTRRMCKIREKGVISTIAANCRLIESMEVVSPFSVGIMQKSIFIPKDVSEADREVIIQHELNHFRCHHHLWSLFEAVLGCVFWFNPIAHILRRRGAFLRELECDGRTVEKTDRYEYTRLLLKTAEMVRVGTSDSQISLLTQGWARKGELRKRIETLMRRDDMKKKTVIGGIIAAGVVITVCITLFYGNLNDLTKEAILTNIDVEYARRAPVSARVELESVPSHFINALLIHEDSEFFEHNGIRLKSIFRAAGGNLKSFLSGGRLYKYGGSTITQQLAKQFLGNFERTIKRKFEELKIARVLEREFTKEEILEMYLNMIYFGNDAIGLKAASDTYFGHDYKSLTLSESAMLVPFIDAPFLLNVLKDPVTAGKRQKHLLERIEAAGKAG